MGVGRTHHVAVKLAVSVFVVDKVATAGQQLCVFETGDRLTDTVFAHFARPSS